MPARPFPVSPWSPAVALLACVAVAAIVGALGHRALDRMSERQLEVVGGFVAHHVEFELVTRLRALGSVAAVDAQVDDPAARDTQRRSMVGNLSRLYPELVWVGFAEQPGRVAVSKGGILAGVDVSGRDWWKAALNGPYVGNAHEAKLLAAAAAKAGGGAELPRLLDVAVPLRSTDGAPYGVLAVHLDANWVLRMRDRMAEVVKPLEGVELMVLQRDGVPVSGRALRVDGPPGATFASAGDGPFAATLDGRPRIVSLHAIDGDVVVSRLGWRIAVLRDPEAHSASSRTFVGWSLAIGAFVGLAAAAAIAMLSSRRARVVP